MRTGIVGPIAAITVAVVAGATVADGASAPNLGSSVEVRVFQFTPSSREYCHTPLPVCDTPVTAIPCTAVSSMSPFRKCLPL